MRFTKLYFLFILITQINFGQAQRITTEDVFRRYLITEDESNAKLIINSEDNLYSLFCQGELTENLNEKINFYTRFIEQDPKYGIEKAYLNRGISYGLSEKYESAIIDYNKYIDMDSEDPYGYYFRGESYLSLEKYEEAIQDYNLAIKINPNFALAFYMRGTCFLYKKNSKNALADFSKVIELDKDYDKAYIMRGVVYLDMDEYKKAISDWKNAKKINKDNAQSVDELIEKASSKMKQ